MRISRLSPKVLQWLNCFIVIASAILCALLALLRFPGMDLLGIGPNWFLIWVVTWSIKRKTWEAALGGIAMGCIQDGLTTTDLSHPSHVVGLVIVGILTSRLQIQRYIQEEFIAVALVVFVLAFLGETITAMQYILHGLRSPDDIWLDHQRIALSSAIISSLWAPVLHYPLNRWWERLKKVS